MFVYHGLGEKVRVSTILCKTVTLKVKNNMNLQAFFQYISDKRFSNGR